MLSSHAALRLVANHGKVTFWDPAGAYGLRSPSTMDSEPTDAITIQRKRDVVITGIPDIPTYLQFRWYVGDVTVEVFEWDVSRQDAQVLETVLHDGSVAGSDAEVFDTETAPAFCTMAISEFLQRFFGFRTGTSPNVVDNRHANPSRFRVRSAKQLDKPVQLRPKFLQTLAPK